MPVNWLDVSPLSFNSLLLLERCQLSWFPGWVPEKELATALGGNPAVAWYIRHKCPEIADWLDKVESLAGIATTTSEEIRSGELAVLNEINDLLVYVVDPAVYDRQAFLGWDSRELTNVADFAGKTVIDVGSGTGRLALTVAPEAGTVFAVEPVANLHHYLRRRARRAGVDNLFAVDGLITDIPFPDAFADIVMGGHVFGNDPEGECQELHRVVRPGGMIILCPGNSDKDNSAHDLLVSQAFEWSRFEEPEDGTKRKYWKTV
ncbi:class I SAM-dependent methyltransferase [Planctomycetota bacterium]